MFNNSKNNKMKTKKSQSLENQAVTFMKIFPMDEKRKELGKIKHSILNEMKILVAEWKKDRDFYFQGMIVVYDQKEYLKKYQKLQTAFMKNHQESERISKEITQILYSFGLEKKAKIWNDQDVYCSNYFAVHQLKKIGLLYNNDLTVIFDPNFRDFTMNRVQRAEQEKIYSQERRKPIDRAS